MAENILGLLLVTSSSNGRNVFRYPPDPTSPLARLSQPIYPQSTFTASDTLSGFARVKGSGNGAGGSNNGGASGFGFGSGQAHGSSDAVYDNHYDALGSGFTAKSSATSLRGRLAPAFDDDAKSKSSGGGGGGGGASGVVFRKRAKKSALQRMMEAGGRDIGESDTSDSDDDSDGSGFDEYNWMGNGYPQAKPNPDGAVDGTGTGKGGPGKDRGLEGSVMFDTNPVRKGSGSGDTGSKVAAGTANATAHDEDRDRANGLGTASDGPGRFIESQYNYSLNYSLDFLADMLTPSRSACNRKFEVCVDELVFIGHPVCAGLDGKWTFPDMEDEAEPRARGRRGREAPAPLHGASHLGTVVEHAESSPESAGGSAKTGDRAPWRDKSATGIRERDEEDGPPQLNLFHLVVILDKPDPKPGSHIESVSPLMGLDEVYREVAFKWTAAAFALQVRDNYIAKEAWEMAKLKEKCLIEHLPIRECNKLVYDNCSLDRALNQLYAEIYQLQVQPANPLYANLPTTISLSLSDLTFTITLFPRISENDDAWAHWNDPDDDASSISAGSDDEEWHDALTTHAVGRKGIKVPDFKVDPWQTLLLLDEHATERASEISAALIGLGVTFTPQDSSLATSPVLAATRRESKDSSVEETEGALIKALIEACDVTKPLSEIAHVLRFDLDGIVIPLARELVQNKRAILIDTINTRLRTIVMPTTIAEHTTTWQEYASRFARRFKGIPDLATFISHISLTPKPFREILPISAQHSLESRNNYFQALIWLLKHDLVIQVHTRARIWARPEVKREAWLKLWHRRRGRWLAARERRSSLSSNARTSRSNGGSSRDTEGKESLSISVLTSPMDALTPRAVKSSFNFYSKPQESAFPTVPGPGTPSGRGDNSYMPLGASLRMDQSYMDYDPNLELDSDEGEDDGDGSPREERDDDNDFSDDMLEPAEESIPVFEGSFIFKPGRAQKDEARWLRVIRESGVVVGDTGRRDEIMASKFDLCVQYFDGVATFEEVSYRTGLPRKELDKLLQLYKDDVFTVLHP